MAIFQGNCYMKVMGMLAWILLEKKKYPWKDEYGHGSRVVLCCLVKETTVLYTKADIHFLEPVKSFSGLGERCWDESGFFDRVWFSLYIYLYTLTPSGTGKGKNIELSKVTLESPINTPKPDDKYYTVWPPCVPLVGDHLTHGSTKQWIKLKNGQKGI